MFTAVLFTIAKTWKRCKCPPTEKWIRNMWYISTVEYYSAIKMNEIMPLASTWRDLEIIILSDVSQKRRQISYNIIFVWNPIKHNTKELI